MTSTNPHDRKVIRPVDDDEMDHIERQLTKIGCLEAHYAVQECMYDAKDWRKCQDQVRDFKNCIENSKK